MDIKFDIDKVFPNTEDKVLKEIILHQKITLEEIMNFLCLCFENQKNIEKNQSGNKNLISSNKNLIELEKKDHRDFILKYKVDSKEKDSRRPLKIDNNFLFNYIPVKCKEDHSEGENVDSCIYSHNNNEINYHFLKFKVFFCKDKDCNKNDCPNAHGSADLRSLWTFYIIIRNKNKRDFVILRRKILESKFFKSVIVSNYETMLPMEFNLNTYKVFKCPLGENCNVDYHYCLNYHDLKERRRDPNFYKVEKNEYCPSVKGEGKLLDSSKCPNGDFCEFFHTRNEINYDTRNFRRITDCFRNNRKPCEFFNVCYGRHYDEKGKLIDSTTEKNSEEMVNFQREKEELINGLQKVSEQFNNITKELKEIESKITPLKCSNSNCSTEFAYSLKILKCRHYFCDVCFQEIMSSLTCYICKKKNEKLVEKNGYYTFEINKLKNFINRNK